MNPSKENVIRFDVGQPAPHWLDNDLVGHIICLET